MAGGQLKILVIDSHKGSSPSEIPQNLHWRNAREIAYLLEADLIWSYPSVNDEIRGGYDKIIFVHASRYNFVDKQWLENSPDAEIFYITNEYNLGEPSILWKPAKAGRHYTVIANHQPEISKVVKKYTKAWHVVNLNALSYKQDISENEQGVLIDWQKQGIVYYGSFRKDRIPSFKKYLTKDVILSTHSKNVSKFREIGVPSNIINRIEWPPKGRGLSDFKYSLYLEDEITHKNYNFLANRFYEALNHNVYPVFTGECMDTCIKSGYSLPIGICSVEEISRDYAKNPAIPQAWHDKAVIERSYALGQISQIING